MYEEFFNLKTKPFDLAPNPDFLFLGKPHRKALTYLRYGIKEKTGFILLTGEVGSGKTTIIRNLIKELNGKVTLSKVFNTKVSSEQLIAMINEDFGLDVAGLDKIALIRKLNDFLIDQYANSYQPILIVDEAQNLTPELLEEVRMLSNLETDRAKLLQIILVGQPELRKTLAQPDLRQLRQRISISCHLTPLTREETEEYILHRLEIAGNREAVIFEDGTIDSIYNFSRGIPRLINILCDFLMLSAYTEETKEVSIDLVKEVVREIETDGRYWQDESPKQYISDKIVILKKIISRIIRLEEAVFKTKITQNEKIEIFERIAAVEKLLNSSVMKKSQTELIKMDNTMRGLADELEALKDVTAELMNRLDEKAEIKKTGLWGRVFS